jgi:hypothetical protein
MQDADQPVADLAAYAAWLRGRYPVSAGHTLTDNQCTAECRASRHRPQAGASGAASWTKFGL